MPEQSKASMIGCTVLSRGSAHFPRAQRLKELSDRYPATLVPQELLPAGKRLTRVGENSACKLHVILQKNSRPTQLGVSGTFHSEITTSSRSVTSLPV